MVPVNIDTLSRGYGMLTAEGTWQVVLRASQLVNEEV